MLFFKYIFNYTSNSLLITGEDRPMIMQQNLLVKEKDNEGNEYILWNVYIDINVCTSVTIEMKTI